MEDATIETIELAYLPSPQQASVNIDRTNTTIEALARLGFLSREVKSTDGKISHNLTETGQEFFLEEEDLAHGGNVYTLTRKGMIRALGFALEKYETIGITSKNINIDIITYHQDHGIIKVEDQTMILEHLCQAPTIEGPQYFIMYRDTHTSVIVKERISGEDCFTIIDSYNAYGAPDADHMPLLQLIRDAYPEAQIITNHDKFQSDYYNCRMFSIRSIFELELARKNRENNVGDPTIFRHLSSGKGTMFFTEERLGSETLTSRSSKTEQYKRLGVKTYPLPAELLILAQSYCLIDKNDALLEHERTKGQTYEAYLKENTEISEVGKKINRTIENFNLEFIRYLSKALEKTPSPQSWCHIL